MLPRKFALPLSLALTALVAFVVTSWASNNGWLSEASQQFQAAVSEDPTSTATLAPTAEIATPSPVPPTATAVQPEVIEVTDYVYQDVPVYRVVAASPIAEPPADVLASSQATTVSPVVSTAPATSPTQVDEDNEPSLSLPSAQSNTPAQVPSTNSVSDQRSVRAAAPSTSSGPNPSAAQSATGPLATSEPEDHEEGDDHSNSTTPSATSEPEHPEAEQEHEDEPEHPEAEHEDAPEVEDNH